jgi:hypothetical protein
MESSRIEYSESETAMTNDSNTSRKNADDRLVANDQPENGQKRPYEAPVLRRHARLPDITAGSISESEWQFDQLEQPD